MSGFNMFNDQLEVGNCKITYRLNCVGNCTADPASNYSEYQIDLKDVSSIRLFKNSRRGFGPEGSIRFQFKESIQERFDRAQSLFSKFSKYNDGYTGAMWAQERQSAEALAVKRAGLADLNSYVMMNNPAKHRKEWFLPKSLDIISLSSMDFAAADSIKLYHANCTN
ncbi:hypothetical protein [uncultured Cohaesibacter sp.]|uniref:hypothetical protein n=1 Tax=uncultured Cohaesibacter sp. TaxID=1002546 RepID=UPI00292CE19A|nr:hypothetical protein [uncultured Cohaesibacter sp.]